MAGVLYRKEREVLEFLAQFQRQYGYSPTLGEIAKATGHRSNATVHALIRSLVEKGYVQKVEGNARVLKIIDQKIAATMTGMQPTIELPLMGFITFGKTLEPHTDPNATIQVSGNFISGKFTAFALQVKGDGFHNAGILEDDVIVVEKATEPKEGEVVIAILDSIALLKKYTKENGKVILQSLHDKSDTLAASHITIQGKVCAVIRKFV